MPRLVLIHWKAEEAESRVEQLRSAGFQADWLSPQGGEGLRPLESDPPDAFVIDLTRIPSHGRAVGQYLRQRKATRNVPLIFAGGEPEKVEATRRLLPDAAYADWDSVANALRKARPPAAPLVPDTMAGYSGVPLTRKLGLKPDVGVALVGAPDGFAKKLGIEKQSRTAERVLLFARSIAELRKRFPQATARVAARGGLWIVWPKKASGIESDLSEAAVRKFGLAAGWVDYKICAVDETWSGLLFARRK